VKRPRLILLATEDEDDPENVVRVVRVDDDEEPRCKSPCAQEAEIVTQTWAYHTELFG
jgi:hypothetical protein